MHRIYGLFFSKENIMDKSDGLLYWRQLFYSIVGLFVMFGTFPSVMIGALTFLKFDIYMGAIMNISFYCASVLIMLIKSIPRRIKYIGIVGSFNLISIYLLLMTGSSGAGAILFIFAFVIGGILLSRSTIKFLVALNVFFFAIGIYLYASGCLNDLPIANFGPGFYVHMTTMLIVSIAIITLIHAVIHALDQQIRQSEKREQQTQYILDNLMTGVLLLDTNGIILKTNPYGRNVFFKEIDCEGSMLDHSLILFDLVTNRPVESLFHLLTKHLETDIAFLYRYHGQIRYITCKLTASTSFDGRQGFMLLLHDVTELRQKEATILHSQKMEAIGTIAGGVAHDFNNMLGGILGYAQLLSETDQQDAEKTQNYLDHIIDSSLKAAQLTKQLLIYARKEEFAFEPIDISLCLTNLISLMDRTFEKKLIPLLHLEDENLWINGDIALLENAFLNISLNAKDAMANNGKLWISAKNMKIDNGNFGEYKLPPGDYIKITFKDQGKGMSPDVVSRIFEPFYTTKETGKGTGLGLAATYGTIMAHQGDVLVESFEGVGTTFDIILPAIEPPLPKAAVPTTEKLIATKAVKKIMIVDDEDVIRQLLSDILMEMGYEVSAFDNGQSALNTLNKDVDQYSMIFLDMIMPGMSGKEVLTHIRQLSQTIPVMIISGFLNDDHYTKLLDLGAQRIINKPFTIDQIVDALKHIRN